jgi:hypothetical protein
MFLRVYYKDSRSCDAHSVAFLDVKGCSNVVFRGMMGHGKSPCFSRCSVLTAVSVDERGVVLIVVDGGFFLD